MSNRSSDLPPPPAGADAVAAWARARRATYLAHPDQNWFRHWEPFDTMVSPEAYFSSVSWALPPGSVTSAEPWYAPIGSEPLDRTLLVFVSHPAFRHRVALRSGEHFNTRVAYVETAPPPRVTLGDVAWDAQIITFAASGRQAAEVLTPVARRLLLGWQFSGHIEVRPGGLIVNFAGARAKPDELERTSNAIRDLVQALLTRS